MLSALLVLVAPSAVLPMVLWPVQQLAGLLMAMASWMGHWPGAQLFTGRPHGWIVALLVLGLLPWLLGARGSLRSWALLPMATALLVHGRMQLGDGLVAVERFGRHWLLARHRGRAALVSTHGNARSCLMARRIAAVHCHARLDWVMLLDPVASDAIPCWQALAHRVEAPQQGRAAIAIGQELRSDGLSVQLLQPRSGSLLLQTGGQRWQLLPRPQSLWAFEEQRRSGPPAGFHRNMDWLQSFRTPAPLASPAWGWLPVHRPLKFSYARGRVERWQSPVDRARLEIV